MKVRKFQFGGPGYFAGSNPLITSKSISPGTKKAAEGFNWFMGKIGDAFASLVAATAVPSGSATGSNVYANSPMYKYNLTHAQPEAKKAIEKASPYISPSNYVAAATLGSLNPKVGAEVLSRDPRLQALGIIGDLLAFKFGPKAVRAVPKTVDRGLAAAGNKGAKGRVVAREMNKTFEGPIDLKELSNHYIEPYVTNSKGSGKLVHYDNGDRASVFRNSGSYIQDEHLYPGLTTKNLGNFTWWNLDNPYLNVHKSKGRFSPSRYIVVDETNQFVHPLKAGKTVGQSDGAGRGFILPGEMVSESPVNLSNAFMLEKDPFGWWNNVKVVGNPTQQATHPWQLSNSKYSRFQLPNGKIRLLLPSHTEAKPRQFVLEPQGDNKYYVHMKVWDDADKKVPATMSSAEKNTLFEALYNELPDGAEILFPQSGPGNYATRGTVAGLLHLARDKRFTPRTKGTLLYLDKDGKTVRTYNGTSFIKNPQMEDVTTLNTESLSRKPIYLDGHGLLEYQDYVTALGDKFKNNGARVELPDLNAGLWKEFDKRQFVPVFLMWPGKSLRAHGQDVIRRMEQMGMDVDKTQGHLPLVGDGSIRYLITKNSELPSFIGYYKKPGISGTYFPETGTTIIDPTRKNSTVYSMQHERNMHGTLRLLTPEMWKPYEDFLYKLFPQLGEKVTPTGKKYLVAYNSEGLEFPINPRSISKTELRATLGEYRKYLYDNVAYSRAKADGLNVKPGDLDVLRPYFENAVDELTFPEAKIGLRDMNGYGRDYVGAAANHPNFLEELKWLLKYAPAASTPLIFKYNEKE